MPNKSNINFALLIDPSYPNLAAVQDAINDIGVIHPEETLGIYITRHAQKKRRMALVFPALHKKVVFDSIESTNSSAILQLNECISLFNLACSLQDCVISLACESNVIEITIKPSKKANYLIEMSKKIFEKAVLSN